MFTVPSGVRAVIATFILRVLLLKLKRKLERGIRRSQRSRANVVYTETRPQSPQRRSLLLPGRVSDGTPVASPGLCKAGGSDQAEVGICRSKPISDRRSGH